MREALITAIAGYKGAVIIVSHDRFLLDSSCDRLWLVADGGVKPFDGDLDDYAKLILENRGGPRNPGRPAIAAAAPPAEPPKPRISIQSVKKRIETIETQIEKFQALLTRVDEALAKPETFASNAERAGQLARDRAAIAEKLAEAEDAWLAAQAELEAAA